MAYINTNNSGDKSLILKQIQPIVNDHVLNESEDIDADLTNKINNLKISSPTTENHIAGENKTANDDKTNMQKIMDIFDKNVKGKKPDVSGYNKNHKGKEGHWLEKMMGIEHNSSNSPDILGYEMKNQTCAKTTFGDWTPDINADGTPVTKWWTSETQKLEFMKKYGKYNEKKQRWAWANPVKYESYNNYGQRFTITDTGVFITYNNQKDIYYTTRVTKNETRGDVLLFGWSHDLLKKRLENKFGKNGYFICKKTNGIYTDIIFYEPILYEKLTDGIKKGRVYLDSGTYQGNARGYMQWRANNDWWTNH